MRHSIFLMNPICMEVLCRPHRQERKRGEAIPWQSEPRYSLSEEILSVGAEVYSAGVLCDT